MNSGSQLAIGIGIMKIIPSSEIVAHTKRLQLEAVAKLGFPDGS
jgi:hypothetical protein